MKKLILLFLVTLTINIQAQDTTGFLTVSTSAICVGDTVELSAGTVGADYGNGSDGKLNATSGTVYTDNVRTTIAGTNLAGSSTLVTSSASGFSVGDEVLIITMVDKATSNNTVGQHEFNTISSIS